MFLPSPSASVITEPSFLVAPSAREPNITGFLVFDIASVCIYFDKYMLILSFANIPIRVPAIWFFSLKSMDVIGSE